MPSINEVIERVNRARPDAIDDETKAAWLLENEPDLMRRAERLLLLEDYLLGWLTGRAVTEPAVQTSTGWYQVLYEEQTLYASAEYLK